MNERHNNNPGKMNKRITFLNPPGEIVGGWPSQEWTEHVKVWAEIKTQKGRRLIEMQAAQMQDIKIFGCRYRSDVNDSMRIRYNGKDYEIESMTNDDENNQWYTILAREVL